LDKRVSVILPVYNGATHLRQAIDSVLGQTSPPEEILAIDDGSRDDSVRILQSYGEALSFSCQANAGVAETRNRGVEEARGDLIAFLDQDDLWYPHKLERQLETMAAAQEAPFVYSDFDLIDRSGAVTRRRALAGMKAQWMRPFIGGHLHPYPSTVLMKRSVFLEEGGFDSGFVENTHEDVDLWVRLHQRIPFVFLPEALVQYRWDHRHHQRKRRSFQVEYANTLRLYRKIEGLHGSDPGRREPLDRLLARVEAMSGKDLAFQGRFREAREHFRRAMQLDPANRRNRWRVWRTFLPARWHRAIFNR